MAELAAFDGANLPAKVMREQLHAVADAEDGYPKLKHVRRKGRGTVVVDAVWAAREDDRAGRQGADAVGGGVPREDLGVDPGLADAADDQARVLRAVVEDDDCLAVRVGVDDVSRGMFVRGVHTGLYGGVR